MSNEFENTDPFEKIETNVSFVKANESKSLVELARQKSNNNNYYYLENAGETGNMIGKGKNKTFNTIIHGIIKNYVVKRQYGDSGIVVHQIEIESDNKIYSYEGYSTKEIADWIYLGNLGSNKNAILTFLDQTIATLRNELSVYGIFGGYNRLEDISQKVSKRPANYLVKWLSENLGEEQLRLLKALILVPFHKILREDETAHPRGLVRSIIAEGDSDQLKTFIVNFMLNCFVTHTSIPLHDNRSSDSIPALRNDCHNHTGILLCDEADKLFVDWIGGGRLTGPAVNFLKRIEQSRSLNVADLNNQGSNLGSMINSTPVCLWNGFIDYIDATLRDRLLYCPFHKENKPEIKEKWSLKKGKGQMLIFGEHIAIAFKEKYDKIKVSDTETATNIILDYLMEVFGYDLGFLKEIQLMYIDGLNDEETIKDNILGALRSYVKEPNRKIAGFEGALEELWTVELEKNNKFRNHLTYSTDEFLRIKCKSFTDWINKMVLKGGEISKEEIANIFNWEIVEYGKNKVFIAYRKDFDNMLSLKEK